MVSVMGARKFAAAENQQFLLAHCFLSDFSGFASGYQSSFLAEDVSSSIEGHIRLENFVIKKLGDKMGSGPRFCRLYCYFVLLSCFI